MGLVSSSSRCILKTQRGEQCQRKQLLPAETGMVKTSDRGGGGVLE